MKSESEQPCVYKDKFLSFYTSLEAILYTSTHCQQYHVENSVFMLRLYALRTGVSLLARRHTLRLCAWWMDLPNSLFLTLSLNMRSKATSPALTGISKLHLASKSRDSKITYVTIEQPTRV